MSEPLNNSYTMSHVPCTQERRRAAIEEMHKSLIVGVREFHKNMREIFLSALKDGSLNTSQCQFYQECLDIINEDEDDNQ